LKKLGVYDTDDAGVPKHGNLASRFPWSIMVGRWRKQDIIDGGREWLRKGERRLICIGARNKRAERYRERNFKDQTKREGIGQEHKSGSRLGIMGRKKNRQSKITRSF